MALVNIHYKIGRDRSDISDLLRDRENLTISVHIVGIGSSLFL